MDKALVDAAFIRRAVEASDLAALRAALIQASGDSEIKTLGPIASLSLEDRERLINRAIYLIESELSSYKKRIPSDQELHEIMDLVLGVPTRDEHFEVRKRWLAFEDFSYCYQSPNGRLRVPEGFKVAIIGAGLSGIAMAVQLELIGVPYSIYERRDQIGGTWSRHKYPDLRVDTLSVTYEYAMEEPYRWSGYFAKGPEVQKYLEDIANKYDIGKHICFNNNLENANFDENNGIWKMIFVDSDGEQQTREANVIVSAAGLFSTTKTLNIPGVEEYQGKIIHPAEWPEDNDLKNKRVAIIGNGSSGVQLLAPVADQADQVNVFQRTAQWISPRQHYGDAIETEVQWLFDNLPGYWNWYRYTSIISLFTWHEDFLIPDNAWEEKGGHITKKSEDLRQILTGYLKTQIGDRPDLLKKLQPDHPPMLRRPVVDNGWYKALTKDNVTLVTQSITRLTHNGIQTDDGKHYEVDVIISAIGFDIVKYLSPTEYRGKAGVSLEEFWSKDSPRAYVGMMMPGFPNLFTLYGPNSQPTSGGIALPSWFQIWASYIAQCLEKLVEEGCSSVEVSETAFKDHNQALDNEAGVMAIVTDSSSVRNYYVNEDGRMQVNSPFETADLWAMQKTPNFDEINFK
tara:strand:- start:126 stop:2006 length:1881 start_codon:yes stop_codon:yes gene_type:complete